MVEETKKRRQTLNYVYARAAAQVMDRGIDDPQPGDIVKQYYKDVPILPPSVTIDVAVKLASIRSILEDEFGKVCVLVNERYYRWKTLASEEQDAFPSEGLLACGASNVSFGLHHVRETNDPLYIAWLNRQSKMVNGSGKKITTRINDATEKGLVDPHAVSGMSFQQITLHNQLYVILELEDQDESQKQITDNETKA